MFVPRRMCFHLPPDSGRRGPGADHRRGAATVEFALFASLLASMMLGAIELGRALMVRQTMSDAARKAARTGIAPGATTASITQEITDILTDNSIDATAATITVLVNGSNVDASTAKRNDQISIKISIPSSKVLWITSVFLGPSSVETETIVMMRQG